MRAHVNSDSVFHCSYLNKLDRGQEKVEGGIMKLGFVNHGSKARNKDRVLEDSYPSRNYLRSAECLAGNGNEDTK